MSGLVWSGLVRSGQVRSGQAMQNYLVLKINIKHSACYTEATYQISRQSGHGAQSNYLGTVDIKIASGYLSIFAIYLHIETDISKSLKVPAILFDTLHGD